MTNISGVINLKLLVFLRPVGLCCVVLLMWNLQKYKIQDLLEADKAPKILNFKTRWSEVQLCQKVKSKWFLQKI